MSIPVGAPQFERIADRYDTSLPAHVVAHYLEKRARFLTEQWPAPARALDVGAGTGLLAARLKRAGWSVVGVDQAAAMLHHMVARGGIVAQAHSAWLPFADETFDVVYCVAMLHHVAEPAAVRATVREMARVTRVGGITVYWDHNPCNPYWPIIMARVPQDTGAERLIPADEIAAALSDLPVEVSISSSGFVGDFVPPSLLGCFARLEQLVERLPGLRRFLCAHNIVVARKYRSVKGIGL